jgi:gamma-glutamyl hercynylcysteine S-oxide synthase
MWRHAICRGVYVCALLCWLAVPIQASRPFGLPECVGDLGSEVVVNAPMLDAMIPLAEPDGIQPNRQYAMLFIISKYYLERSHGLLVISRDSPEQRPLLLTEQCAPYPEAPAHLRAYFAELTAEQQKAFGRYQGFVWPPAQLPPLPAGNMARIAAGPFAQRDGKTMTLAAFAIDIYEVTNAQYRQFIEAGGYTTQNLWSEAGWAWVRSQDRRQASYWDNTQLNAPEQPVVGVSWYEAEAYCRWAGKVLPTEPQWDKACRGDDKRSFPWGNTPLQQSVASVSGSSAERQFSTPAVVGSAPQTQSPYGVHDLAGNVLEWTHTTHDGQQFVLCGGSGDVQSPHVGCGVRYTLLPGIAANFIGFRCVATTP